MRRLPHYQKTTPDPDRPGWHVTHICGHADCAGQDDPRHAKSYRDGTGTMELQICPPPGRDISELVKPDGPIRSPDCDD